MYSVIEILWLRWYNMEKGVLLNCITDKKEEDTMAAVTKPMEQAFVLSTEKSEAFLKQNNNQFKSAMTKFEKFTKKSHSVPKKS